MKTGWWHDLLSIPRREWRRDKLILKLSSDWVDIYCEQWRMPTDETCEYWRVERANSMIVVPVRGDTFLLPKPEFRPGVNDSTLDFPGGRILPSEEASLSASVERILAKELGIEREQIKSIDMLENRGKIINSSFNSQKLFVARADVLKLDLKTADCIRVPIADNATLLDKLDCLQCAFALNSFMKNNSR